MKKVLLFITLLAGWSFTATAQEVKDTVNVEGMTIVVNDEDHVQQTRFKNNWYLGVQGGVVQSWGSYTSRLDFTKKLGATAAIVFGKEITPVSEIRAQLMYNQNVGNFYFEDANTDVKHKFNTLGLYLAYMPNLTNLILGYKPGRMFNLKGVVGIGGETSWGFNGDLEQYYDKKRELVGLQFGLNMAFRLSDACNLTLEATEHFLDDSYDRNIMQEKHTWDGHLNVMVGLTYALNKHKEKRHFQLVQRDVEQFTTLQDRINDVRAKAQYMKEHPNVETNTVNVDKNIIYTLIAFDPQTATVDRLQQSNVFTTAKVWEHNPDSKIFICNSTGVDDKLFQKRAEAITDLLSERYSIPKSAIKAVANEKELKSLKLKNKTYIVFIVNE